MKKLKLKKETIFSLNNQELDRIVGGTGASTSCNTKCTCNSKCSTCCS